MTTSPLFADECCSAHLVKALRAAGCDVAYVVEISSGLDDLSQARAAFDQGRVVISADYDFGELAVRRVEPFVGLVLLGPSLELENAMYARSVADRIVSLGATMVGQLTNLEKDAARQRRL